LVTLKFAASQQICRLARDKLGLKNSANLSDCVNRPGRSSQSDKSLNTGYCRTCDPQTFKAIEIGICTPGETRVKLTTSENLPFDAGPFASASRWGQS
jgi:hypothetical protein